MRRLVRPRVKENYRPTPPVIIQVLFYFFAALASFRYIILLSLSLYTLIPPFFFYHWVRKKKSITAAHAHLYRFNMGEKNPQTRTRWTFREWKGFLPCAGCLSDITRPFRTGPVLMLPFRIPHWPVVDWTSARALYEPVRRASCGECLSLCNGNY